VCGVVIRGEKSQRMDAAYLFICKGVYRRIFLIVVGSEEFNVVSRVEECRVQNDDLPTLLRAALVLVH
jgi:hypothetical protein